MLACVDLPVVGSASGKPGALEWSGAGSRSVNFERFTHRNRAGHRAASATKVDGIGRLAMIEMDLHDAVNLFFSHRIVA
ncbi:hypothetical protein Rcae01_01116 [Novipirellula caenicola]|uniref:Uncharacterized protein n=1 Tax=Novipirellula caenicola TaxID=1536901 RepID=A0ABP9VLY3_9BACT